MTETMIGLGESLKNRRRQKNYTLEMVGRETKISQRFLRALEDEKWAEFPAKVYLEGFLRQYANFLGLDGEDFVKKWREAQAQPDVPALTRVSSSHRTESDETDKLFRPEFLFLGAIVIFLVALYFFTSRMERSGSRSAEEPSSAVSTQQETAVPAATHSNELQVYAKKAVWMRVWADQRVRFEGIIPRESRKTWPGMTSFRVQFADAGALDVAVNGLALSPSREGEIVWFSTHSAATELPVSTDTSSSAPGQQFPRPLSGGTGGAVRRAPAMEPAQTTPSSSQPASEPARRRLSEPAGGTPR
jgi:cytoskeletal protein RodZ